MIVAVTGHRPNSLEDGYSLLTRRALGAFAIQHLHYNRPDHVITGMALGWDQAVAAACAVLQIPFTAAVPFDGQDRLWPMESQQRYHRLIGYAAKVFVVSDTPGAYAMRLRNEWMVDRADAVLALWNGSITGGTANCVRYAVKKGKPLTNLWSDWLATDPLDSLLG